MTRREEIEQAAFNYINSDVVSAENMQLAYGDFINGAQWADKTMIERVEQWLIKNNRGQTIGSLHRFLEEE